MESVFSFVLSIHNILKDKVGLKEYFSHFGLLRLRPAIVYKNRTSVKKVVEREELHKYRVIRKLHPQSGAMF